MADVELASARFFSVDPFVDETPPPPPESVREAVSATLADEGGRDSVIRWISAAWIVFMLGAAMGYAHHVIESVGAFNIKLTHTLGGMGIIATAMMMMKAVRSRDAIAAAGLTFVMAVPVLPVWYGTAMMTDWPEASLTELPAYVDMRLQTDVVTEHGRESCDRGQNIIWFAFAAGLYLVVCPISVPYAMRQQERKEVLGV